MRRYLFQKLKSRRGINRLVLLLLIAVLVLLAATAVPIYRAYKERADIYSCSLALKKAQDALMDEYLLSGWTQLDLEEAHSVVDKSKWSRDTLCPAGGDYYIIQDESDGQNLTVVCGIHETDLKLRTRLNAENVLRQITGAVAEDRLLGRLDPDSVAVSLNGETLTASRVTEETGLRWGTLATSGYEGTVAFYMLDAEGVSYFSFADEDHCANYRRGEGWWGDSYT